VNYSCCHSERSVAERRISSVPILTEVGPIRIACSYQFDFLLPEPALYGFLPGNSRIDIAKRFKVKQPIDVIFFGKAFNQLILMFESSFLDVVGQSDIKRAGFVSHNVNVVLITCLHILHCTPNRLCRPEPSASHGQFVIPSLRSRTGLNEAKNLETAAMRLSSTMARCFAPLNMTEKAKDDKLSERQI